MEETKKDIGGNRSVHSIAQKTPLNELRARNVLSAMKEGGRMRDTNTREKFARNLGHILASRKNRLNFSDLVVRAGISKNDDPNRLGRFRILPGRKANEKSIGRLSQDPLAYYRIVQETALITEENPHDLLLELIIGTKFEGKELAEVSIEPFEQLLALVRKKIDVLDAKYDLTSYFKNLRQYEILPVWESGPYCSGRRTSHHSYKRSNCVSWQATTFNEFQSWRYQIMPCVPLCRVPSGSTKSLDVNYTVGRKTFDETWNVFRRLYLAIGMFDHEYSVPTGEVVRENEELGPIEVWEAKFVEDSAPRPYLVAVQELQQFDYGFGAPAPFEVVTGGVSYEQMPFYFYDPDAGIKINSIKEHFLLESGKEMPAWYRDNFGCGHLDFLEDVFRLDLSAFREIFGKTRGVSFFEGRKFEYAGDDIVSIGDDALDVTRGKLTLSPQNTLASLLEADLLAPLDSGDSLDQMGRKNVLDILEADVEQMTSSFREWFQETQQGLHRQHVTLLEKYDSELEAVRRAGPSPNSPRPHQSAHKDK